MERVGDRQGQMERCCSTGQSPQVTVAPTEEEEDIACPCSCFTALCENLLHLSSRGPDCAVLRPT